MSEQWPNVMTPEQVAQYLQLSVRQVQQLLKDGELPGVKVGRQWRIRKDELDAALSAAKRSEPERMN